MQPTVFVADSCACGLALFRHFTEKSPFKWKYFADGKNNPFGTKSKDVVTEIVYNWLELNRQNSIKIMVIACNTASLAINQYKKKWQKEFSIEIIDMIDGLCHKAKKLSGSKVTAIMGTPLTIKLGIYRSILSDLYPDHRLIDMPAPATERLVARNLWKEGDEYQKASTEISAYATNSLDSLVLACTCYEMAMPLLKENLGQLEYINPMEGVAEKLRITMKKLSGESNISKSPGEYLDKTPLENLTIYASGDLNSWERNLNEMSFNLFKRKFKVHSL